MYHQQIDSNCEFKYKLTTFYERVFIQSQIPYIKKNAKDNNETLNYLNNKHEAIEGEILANLSW